MLRKLQYVFLVGSIGLIGADRIDLFAGRGSFILTPFLVLAPLVVLLHLLRTGLRGTLHFPITPPVRRQVPFVAASCLFLLLSFASIPLSLDPERSLVAFCDLLLVAVLGYCISLQILAEPAHRKVDCSQRYARPVRICNFLHCRVHRVEPWTGHRCR